MDGPPQQDIIYFLNGDVMSGEVLNKSLRLLTPYSLIELPLRKCAEVSLETAQSKLTTLITVNENHLTGIFVDREIRFRPILSGSSEGIPTEKIERILLRQPPGKPCLLDSLSRTGLLFVMANHDLLTGTPEEEGLRLWIDGKEFRVPFSDVKSVVIEDGNPLEARVKQKNGTLLQGVLETEDITLQLDAGVRIERIPIDGFDRIFTDTGMQQEPENFVSKNLPATITNSIGMKLQLIQAGSSRTGSGGANEEESPRNEIALSEPYYIGAYEVTQEQWTSVMGSNPSYFSDPSRPVEMVSWNDAREFCRKLSAMERVEYRLPTEAEWEFACRAGTTTEYPWGNTFQGEYAWCSDNSGGKTQLVGTRKANPWGLYDMSGNVWEWCEDLYARHAGEQTDHPPGNGGSDRTLRGGGWFNVPERCRSASRDYRNADYNLSSFIGFRIVRSP